MPVWMQNFETVYFKRLWTGW